MRDRSSAIRLAQLVHLAGLAGLGVASTLLYALGITARYPLAAGLHIPRSGWYRLSGRSLGAALAHAAVYALLIVCYAAAW